ncbi:MAG TPA: malate synthase A [Candidatus Limnocylindrales bacterium]|nr:malate synthase A [Candidatus Limnocylindrales bacterium]
MIEVHGPAAPGSDAILTPDALSFLADLETRFGPRREALLAARRDRQAAIDRGADLEFDPATAELRAADWTVPRAPADFDDRRVEITGPAEPKMMINALNSGARVFMADLEDALSPTWANVVGGQVALRDAVRGELTFTSPEGKAYRVGDRPAQLVVRPRGWHLEERHLRLDGRPLSAALVDAGLYLFHDGAERVRRGTAPYLYLPKLQAAAEAALWHDVFAFAEERLVIPRGSIRTTVLIETIHAAFQMDEILHALGPYAGGLNAGRWDYLFSCIKTFRTRPDRILPERALLTMTTPFMRAYTELLVATCHRRGAHAIGGMAAFIPSRRDAAVNETAMARVRADKERESGDGFDGTWVAHPDLVPLATEIFDGVLGDRPNQKDRLRPDVRVTAADLLDFRVPDGRVTEAGVRLNVSVALQYLDAWLSGNGAAAINNLMEDAATAEISRSQLWQWRVGGTRLDDGRSVTGGLYTAIRDEELAALGGPRGGNGRLAEAAEILDGLVLDDAFTEFLTIPAGALLD